MIDVFVKVKLGHPDARMPVYKTKGSAGCDVTSIEDVVIEAGETISVRTGVFLEIPEGYECQVRPRSGLALQHNVTVLNSPGTVDCDYRGEIIVLLHNAHKDQLCSIKKGDRIAQLVFAPVCTARFSESSDLSETERGSNGFGSTGR